MNDDQLGLELSSSRGNSSNDLTALPINDIIKPTLTPFTEEFMFDNKLVTPISPNRKLSRPISYSDSFVFQVSGKKPDNSGITIIGSGQSLCQPFLPDNLAPIGINSGLARKPDARKENNFMNKLISITVHISLISVFENIFFWQFISKSEDTALQSTIDNFLQGTLSQCNTWSPNATALIKTLFDIFVNQTEINQSATLAYSTRNQLNYNLFVQSWIYYISLLSLVIIMSGITYYKKYKIKWKEVAMDNILLVVLLGLYEYTFFKTIAMQYGNITLPELENNIINQLQNQCNI
jgi:uncharacterized membrane protein YqhA